MKFEFNWVNGLLENYVLIYWRDSNMSDLRWKGKGQPWPLILIDWFDSLRPLNNLSVMRDGSSWVEPVLS